MTFAALAVLTVASAAPAQQRDRDRRAERTDRGERSAREQEQSPQSPARPAPQQGYSDRYAILEKNNIFVRDRSRPTTRSSSPTTSPQTRRSPEESLVVRGIAMEELGYRAYIEDLNNGTTLRVSPGEPLGRGYVTAIALDAIQFDYGGKQTWVEIGSDLTGKESTAAMFSSADGSAAATTRPATLPANVDLNDPSLTVEQRMRLRVQLQRQQREQ